MALSSSQIYVATYRAKTEDESQPNPAMTPRTRVQESTNTSRWRFGRSSTNLREPDMRSSSSTPRGESPSSNAPKRTLERSASKMSLFNLFSKPKVEKARGHTEVGLAVPMRPQTPPKTTPLLSSPRSSLRQNPSPPAQQTIRARSSQIFRPLSMRPPSLPQNETGGWDPPPLFQAFPQSIKHATVQACVFAPELLMRTHSQRRQAEALLKRMDSERDLSVIAEDGTEAKKLERTHRRLISNAVLHPPAPELINKIYILVTAGYILQYAGDGPFDRLPEKVLKLGKESAAFACDLITGKHWVLQISSHACDDGTIEAGPRNSLLSRLRSHSSITRKSATSFLLVLESAEEMDSWMTAVRKEIDHQGGSKVKDGSGRASTSIDGSKEKTSSDTSHRYQFHRDPNAPSRIPVDSPVQSQYGSPQIITSDWESSRSERTTSIAESSSGQSYHYGIHRQSVESSSAASTPVSQDQVQLDQLRGRPRFSFVSATTSASTPGTRNTSRSSSPVPETPLVDGSPTIVEGEPFRSATSLKSFHMNPGSSMASRRRSMQPLPVTNEDFAPAEKLVIGRQRHSLYGPTSPKMGDIESSLALPARPTLAERTENHRDRLETAINLNRAKVPNPIPTQPGTEVVLPKLNSLQNQLREDNSVRSTIPSHTMPTRRDVVSPPPREPAPLPPPSASRKSMMGAMTMINTSTGVQPTDQGPEQRAARRISATPRPFMRPFPVRPQQQHTDQATIIPRRLSSLPPSAKPAPLPLRVNIDRSVTAPLLLSSSAKVAANPQSSCRSLNSQLDPSLYRPAPTTSRTSQPSFPIVSRPVRAVASTPSFVPTKRTSTPNALPSLVQNTPLSAGGLRNLHSRNHKNVIVAPRRSSSAIGLPPPLPPPDLPLPSPPPGSLVQNLASQNSTIPCLQTPLPLPHMPLPSLPPSTPLPPLPLSAAR